METIFSIHQVFRYKNHVIKAEKRSLFYTMEYSLIIDDVKQDQIKGLYGILILHGMLNDNGHQKPLKVIVKQTIFVMGTVLVTIKYDSGSVAYFID